MKHEQWTISAPYSALPSPPSRTAIVGHSATHWGANDVLLPVQFFHHADDTYKMRGEIALLYAVLDDAITCLQKRQRNIDYRTRRLAKDAELWFFTDDHHSPFSFVNICAVLGLDPEYLRLGLTRWRHQHQAHAKKKHPRTPVSRTPKLAG
jgi:hypothetical protein